MLEVTRINALEVAPPSLKYCIILFCFGVLPMCKYVHFVYAWFLQRPEESLGSPGTGITDLVRYHVGAGN